MSITPFQALACPLDGTPLHCTGSAWPCASGHSFDIASQRSRLGRDRFFERFWFLAFYENFERPSTLLTFSPKWGKTTWGNNA